MRLGTVGGPAEQGGGGGDVTTQATFCSYAVASFLWGLGAGFVGLLALLGVTLTGPFGIVLGPAMLGWIAGFMGSWSVLLAAVSFYIC